MEYPTGEADKSTGRAIFLVEEWRLVIQKLSDARSRVAQGQIKVGRNSHANPKKRVAFAGGLSAPRNIRSGAAGSNAAKPSPAKRGAAKRVGQGFVAARASGGDFVGARLARCAHVTARRERLNHESLRSGAEGALIGEHPQSLEHLNVSINFDTYGDLQ
jgi:hypothetical protein